MGKFANAVNWHKFQPLESAPEEFEEPEFEEPLTEEQKGATWDDKYWERRDDTVADAVRRYARPVVHVSLMDEAGVMR